MFLFVPAKVQKFMVASLIIIEKLAQEIIKGSAKRDKILTNPAPLLE